MRISEIYYDDHFERRYRRLSTRVKEVAKAKEALFRENPFDTQLKTHKLHGRDQSMWAFSVNYHYRIKFVFLTETEVLFLDIGTHDQVY